MSDPLYGIDPELEDAATKLLMAERREEISRYHCNINDWFTEVQWGNRFSHEVYPTGGFPGEYQRRGVFGRVHNPMLGRRPDPKHLWRLGMDPWRQFLWEDIDDWHYHPGKMQYPRSNIGDRRPFADEVAEGMAVDGE